MIDVALLSPGDPLIVGSLEGIGALACLLVAFLGARASTDRPRSSALRWVGNPGYMDGLVGQLTEREIVVVEPDQGVLT